MIMETRSVPARTRPVPGSQYVFAADLVDEGAQVVADQVRAQGLSAISLAMAYHQSRDVVPHPGAKPRVRYRQDGVNFEPDPTIWGSSRVQPKVQSATDVAAVAELLGLEDRIEVEAWLVILHNTELGERYPELTCETSFGDKLRAHLCPTNPDAVEYAVNLSRQVSAMGMDVIAEGLNFQPFPHGHHHERSFSPVGPGDEILLSLCFCQHCEAAGNAQGIPMVELRQRICDQVDQAFDRPDQLDSTLEALAGAVGEEVLALIELRERIVADVARKVADAVHENGRLFSYMDLMGSVLSYDHGVPSGAPAAQQAWRLGIDIEQVAAVSDSVTVLAYSADTGRLESDVASYVPLLGGKPLRVIMRPGHPDTTSTEHLARKIEACGAAGASQVDFYNYGMYTHRVLDRIRAGW